MTNQGTEKKPRRQDGNDSVEREGPDAIKSRPFGLIADIRVTGVKLLRGSLAHAPGITVMVEYESKSQDGTAVFVSAVGGAFDDFEAGLDQDGTIESSERISGGDDRCLYRIRPAIDCPLLPSNLDWLGGRVRDERVDHVAWQLRIGLADRERLKAFNIYCRNQDLDPQIVHLAAPTDETGLDNNRLRSDQHRLLQTAYQEGYFENPREVSQADLAEEFGTSSPTISHRIRRATANLIQSKLL